MTGTKTTSGAGPSAPQADQDAKAQTSPARAQSALEQLCDWVFGPRVRHAASIALCGVAGIIGGAEPASVAVADNSVVYTTRPLTDYVEMIERCHLYDEKGIHRCDELIYWEWNKKLNCLVVRDWKNLKSDAQIPQRDWKIESGHKYVARWNDGGKLREVHAISIHESWAVMGYDDPEILNRAIWPKENRRGLAEDQTPKSAHTPSRPSKIEQPTDSPSMRKSRSEPQL